MGHYVQAYCVRFNTALDAARSEWTTTTLEARQTILISIGNELIERRIEFLTPLSHEKGKSLSNWVGEVFRTGQFFTCHAAGNPE